LEAKFSAADRRRKSFRFKLGRQGDQIDRIFDIWEVFFTLGQFLLRKKAILLGIRWNRKSYELDLKKYGLGLGLGLGLHVFGSTSSHPVGRQTKQPL
jgi:hypothetical protein